MLSLFRNVSARAQVDPACVDISTGGPPWTWVATTLGPSGTPAYGLSWPLAVGSLVLALGWGRLRRGDLP